MASPAEATLDRLAADVASGALRVPIARTYQLEETPQALADFGAGTLGQARRGRLTWKGSRSASPSSAARAGSGAWIIICF